jgi:LmbE family N-acetylglucosaminyl deacetylase
MIFPDLLDEGVLPHDVRRLYIHGHDKPDTWVDIGETIELKIEALKQHVSQGDTHEAEDRMREWAAEEGREMNMKFAEAFRVMLLQGEEDDPRE